MSASLPAPAARRLTPGPAESLSEPADPSQPVQSRVAEAFSRAAEHYDEWAVVQKRAGRRLLDLIHGQPKCLLDAGAGSGWLTRQLAERCPQATLFALDLAPGMLQFLRAHSLPAACCVQADMARQPFRSASMDLLFSNFAMQWLPQPAAFFGECARVLKPGGQLLVTTLVPGTLHELEHSWRAASKSPHINQFCSAGQLHGDLARSGFGEAEISLRTERVWYPDVRTLLKALKAIGANTVTAPGYHTSALGGRSALRSMTLAYERFRCRDGLPASYVIATIKARL